MIAVGDITHYLGDAICLVAAEDSGDSGQGQGAGEGGL